MNRTQIMDACLHVGRVVGPHEATLQLNDEQVARLEDRNIMTPTRISLRQIGQRIVEISFGEFMGSPLAGVTVFSLDDPEEDHALSGVAHNLRELVARLKSLQ